MSNRISPEQALAKLRATVRTLILEQGISISPVGDTNEDVDEVIATVLRTRAPKHDAECRVVEAEVAAKADRDTAITVSDQFGAVGAAYGDAGYFVGVCAGLELAALTCGDTSTPSRFANSRRTKRGVVRSATSTRRRTKRGAQ